ncbi:MAG: lysophospholipid acyltransferase family protein [Paracoccaceae bacterium]|nr:lysophospholipid acyltransferase family protein [Paracoccaceae bacterium]
MAKKRHVARDISYASSAKGRSGRALIRVVENATGRVGLIRRAKGYEADVAQGRDFWQVMVDRYGLTLDVVRGSVEDIPANGPLILVSNHPYGILDGLIMGHILSALRGDFRIIAHRVFRRADVLNRVILPISFDETREAAATNLATRKQALDYLAAGGAIGIFPGGTVSTASRPFGQAIDPAWRNFTAKMIARSNATVVPVYFEGSNSRLFQIASRLHVNLRMALLIKEFRARVDTPVRIAVGQPIDRRRLNELADSPKRMMDFLREQTYALSPKPLKSLDYGYEFESKYKA